MDKNELVAGLREGLQTKSYMNNAVMPITSMVEYIDMNVHGRAQEIKDLLVTTSKVGKNQITVGELVAWCDWHLNYTVPDLIRHQAWMTLAYYQSIVDKRTGAVYIFRPGERPIFRHVKNWDEYHFLASSRLAPPADAIIQAEGNLVDFLHRELTEMAVDKSRIQALQPPPAPKTYTVVAGDTLRKIVAKLAEQGVNVTIDQLVAWNALPNADQINVDQVLVVSGKA